MVLQEVDVRYLEIQAGQRVCLSVGAGVVSVDVMMLWWNCWCRECDCKVFCGWDPLERGQVCNLEPRRGNLKTTWFCSLLLTDKFVKKCIEKYSSQMQRGWFFPEVEIRYLENRIWAASMSVGRCWRSLCWLWCFVVVADLWRWLSILL